MSRRRICRNQSRTLALAARLHWAGTSPSTPLPQLHRPCPASTHPMPRSEGHTASANAHSRPVAWEATRRSLAPPPHISKCCPRPPPPFFAAAAKVAGTGWHAELSHARQKLAWHHGSAQELDDASASRPLCSRRRGRVSARWTVVTIAFHRRRHRADGKAFYFCVDVSMSSPPPQRQARSLPPFPSLVPLVRGPSHGAPFQKTLPRC